MDSTIDMTKAVQTPDEMNCVLSPQILALGQALAPVAKAARKALDGKVRSSGQDFATLEFLGLHMGRIEHALTRLTSRLEGLMSNVIRKDGVGLIDVGRSSGRLEQVISELVDGFHDAKAFHAPAESIEARALILGVYRHHIRDICDWLDDLVASISNPAGALKRRGIEPSNDVILNISINLTSPPEMVKIGALVQKLQTQHEERVESPIRPKHARDDRVGVLGTMGALAFGLGLSQAVFGKRHD